MIEARFLFSTLDDVPPFFDSNKKPLPEVALVGRSNVGKSSLINHFLNRKNLAKVSGQPGKTQTINYFSVEDRFILVDLPGYGFAARSHEMQQKWSEAIDHYLNNRKTLALVILLIDSRREASDEDLAIIEWAKHHKKPLLLILTKSDTLKTPKKLPMEDCLLYTIKESAPRKQLQKRIDAIIA